MESHNVSGSSAVESGDKSDGEEIWCLKRVGRNSEWLRLHENTEVTLGRGMNVTYQILSPTCPLMISRNHCAFKQNSDGQWTVTDNKSLNGVWVNGERIPAEVAVQLKIGDSIKLGVPVDAAEAEFEYTLLRDSLQTVKPFLQLKLVEDDAASKMKKVKRKFSMEEIDSGAAVDSKSKLYRCSPMDKSLGRSCPMEEVAQRSPGVREAAGPSGTSSQLQGLQASSYSSEELALLQQHKHNIQMLKSKLLDVEQQTANLKVKQPAREVAKLQEKLNMLREKLHFQREKQLERVKILEESFYEEKHLELERRQLQEESLKKQLEETLLEHRKVIEELKHCRQGFEEILQAKDKELEETKEEKEKARAQKEEVVTQMTEVLENELQCIICSELFIEAVTLNCAHSFCLHCIGEWRKRKDECPICRQVITSQTRSLVLDNCIDRMVDNLSSEMKERRQGLISQRKAVRHAAAEVMGDDDSLSNSSLLGSSSRVGSAFLSSSSDSDSGGSSSTSSDHSLDSNFMSSVLSQGESNFSWDQDTSSLSDSSLSFSDNS